MGARAAGMNNLGLGPSERNAITWSSNMGKACLDWGRRNPKGTLTMNFRGLPNTPMNRENAVLGALQDALTQEKVTTLISRVLHPNQGIFAGVKPKPQSY